MRTSGWLLTPVYLAILGGYSIAIATRQARLKAEAKRKL
jgi:hypothetical protein